MTKGTETEHMTGHPTDNAMKSNFEKICKWLGRTNGTVYSEWASCKNKYIGRKRSKYLLFTSFWTRVFKGSWFTNMASTLLSEQWYKYKKELLLLPQFY